ncbi:efflux transporter outer membrane subunit [Sphingomonas crocodyli]|uniref:Efflux transporter outer membrane subunit n=1 Tax=Sphingomonas crocodyli TaxID=1979270 RepID=A0A437M094_9SPHN|nr:efflux transporter outer membrane subunit [Sphingomonas crocodyli]RVT91042.1 efflux transporter outer membrane subunit [Sphingomonas crocodyli]
MRSFALLPALLLAGCSMAPAYRPAEAPVAAAYKEQVPGWAQAAPADAAPRGDWWTAFGDPVLDDLEARAAAGSPTIAAAVARYDQATAIARRANAEIFPEISAGGAISRERLSAGRPQSIGNRPKYTDKTIGGSFDWEIDLWGRLRDGARAGVLERQASAADLASARLSLQAAVASGYFALRGSDAEIALLRRTIDEFARAEKLTDNRHEGGIASGLDLGRAQAQLSGAKADLSQALLDRAMLEHALAALIGESPSTFTIASAAMSARPIAAPVATPSQLLERRPDIAAAERRMAAANQRIGVARAAWFPALTLGLDGGWQTTSGDILTKSNSFWALGPLSLLGPIFDAGRRTADVKRARGEFDEASAEYRGTVLGAFREVEDNLAAARELTSAERDQDAAASAATRTGDLALTRYHDGASDYLEVVVAQTAALQAERAAIGVRVRRLQASVQLVRALGGGFDKTVLAQKP